MQKFRVTVTVPRTGATFSCGVIAASRRGAVDAASARLREDEELPSSEHIRLDSLTAM